MLLKIGELVIRLHCLLRGHDGRRRIFEDKFVWFSYVDCFRCGRRLLTGPTRMW